MPPKNDPKLESEQMEEVQETPKKGIPKLYILLGFVVLILLQATLLVLLLPGAPQATESSEEAVPSEVPIPDGGRSSLLPNAIPLKSDEIEFKIGEPFEVQSPAPNSAEKTDIYTVQFYARIKKEDETKFTPVYEANANTIRYEIRTVLMKADRSDKQDPNQTKIRHQVEVKINDILGKPYIKRIITPEYKFDTI